MSHENQRWTITRPEFELMVMASEQEPRPLVMIRATPNSFDGASHAAVRTFYRVDPPTPEFSELYLSVLEVVPLIRGHWMVCGAPPCRFEDVCVVNVELMLSMVRYARLDPRHENT